MASRKEYIHPIPSHLVADNHTEGRMRERLNELLNGDITMLQLRKDWKLSQVRMERLLTDLGLAFSQSLRSWYVFKKPAKEHSMTEWNMADSNPEEGTWSAPPIAIKDMNMMGNGDMSMSSRTTSAMLLKQARALIVRAAASLSERDAVIGERDATIMTLQARIKDLEMQLQEGTIEQSEQDALATEMSNLERMLGE